MNNLTQHLRIVQPAMMQELEAGLTSSPHRFTLGVTSVAVSLKPVARLAEFVPDSSLPQDIRRSVFQRKVSFIAGRLCAEAALNQIGVVSGIVGRCDSGAPVWPDAITGSITHTDHLACAAVVHSGTSQDFDIGIDSETILNDVELNDVRKLCLTRDEDIRLVNTVNHNLIGTIVFSVKEALYKALYPQVNRFIDFSEIELRSIDWHRSEIHLQPVVEGDLSLAMAQSRAYFCIRNNTVHTSLQIVHPRLRS